MEIKQKPVAHENLTAQKFQKFDSQRFTVKFCSKSLLTLPRWIHWFTLPVVLKCRQFLTMYVHLSNQPKLIWRSACWREFSWIHCNTEMANLPTGNSIILDQSCPFILEIAFLCLLMHGFSLQTDIPRKSSPNWNAFIKDLHKYYQFDLIVKNLIVASNLLIWRLTSTLQRHPVSCSFNLMHHMEH